MAAHSTLTTTELHEPKGAAAASANTVYVADGAASGAWAKIDSDNIDTASIFNINSFEISKTLADVSTAETMYIPTARAITVKKIVTCLQGVITGSDTTLTAKNAAGTSMGSITIAVSGSGAGVIDTLEPSANNTITADSFFTIETDGVSSGSSKMTIVIECLRTS